ncbi:C2 domain-containing protein Fic1 [Schizosaccharomyces cryophilus OY26]|uniref:C2 domain-containing protein Fic1 n=1 Tax=Schizosaccharomyces cryophilus (strain OY26 / ATCC MYA-4695 / CBS 11777 / NBRC 106824 / NRRL Y48691) TaxID=653667 RepID=S9VSS8_SCHCR|nr:C2 domain-containing protein Fic1 [Schizosaccharomyces cryophilus OY26]EPY49190.1 C2 domain-containing protein Fic1 [Schizosaccharomyces cryophilus OY26]
MSKKNELGTLIVRVANAKNLPNKALVGKQSPYCSCRVGAIVKRTHTDKRSGQAPSWNAVLEFPIPSESYNVMKVYVYHEGFRKHSHLIGDTVLSFQKALQEGDQSQWYELKNDFQFAGEISVQFKFLPSDPDYFKFVNPSSTSLPFPQFSVATLASLPASSSRPSSSTENTQRKGKAHHPLPTPPVIISKDYSTFPEDRSSLSHQANDLPSFPSPSMVDEYYYYHDDIPESIDEFPNAESSIYPHSNLPPIPIDQEDFDYYHPLPPVPPPHASYQDSFPSSSYNH